MTELCILPFLPGASMFVKQVMLAPVSPIRFIHELTERVVDSPESAMHVVMGMACLHIQ